MTESPEGKSPELLLWLRLASVYLNTYGWGCQEAWDLQGLEVEGREDGPRSALFALVPSD